MRRQNRSRNPAGFETLEADSREQVMEKTIPMVGDDPEPAGGISRGLEQNPCRTVDASGGRDGRRRKLEERADLLILDVVMETGTTGFEMACQMRSRRPGSRFAAFKDIPIPLTTAVSQVTRSRLSLNEWGRLLRAVQSFVTRPLSTNEHLARVEAPLGTGPTAQDVRT
jgi:response regulator RpfG family c-di-GMP phosphodiesterase